MESLFRIAADVEVICPRCKAKAGFFYPFRKIFPGNLSDIRNSFPNASLELFTDNEFPEIFYVNQFDDSGSAAVSLDSIFGLLNLDNKNFDRRSITDSRSGLLKCGNCGLITKHSLTQESYFYKIAIGNRFLVARNISQLKSIRDHFSDEHRSKLSPDEDFPKSFYKHREEIVRKIDAILNQK